jgi:hypothetical protein
MFRPPWWHPASPEEVLWHSQNSIDPINMETRRFETATVEKLFREIGNVFRTQVKNPEKVVRVIHIPNAAEGATLTVHMDGDRERALGALKRQMACLNCRERPLCRKANCELRNTSVALSLLILNVSIFQNHTGAISE